ncbi:MAG: tRNA-guanine transglycosylase, partial [Candidatus Lokiarchaeota archaeon]|nr:tRNA-guanine transglycosylase [Candidatus Lokiarchaeota archaeon]
MHFEILETDGLARIAKIEVNGKNLITPNLFAVVKPSGNLITPYELKRLGVDCIFTNAYILYQNEILKERALRNGIHKLLDYDGIIATDSGAFQQYMYNDKIDINPEDIELFQENIGSDFPVILDIPVQPNDTYEVAKNKVLKTIERAKENIKRRKHTKSEWMGPIHGGKYKDLLEMSAKEMSKLDFGIYAIGGLVKFFIDYRFDLVVDILLTVKNNIIPNRPLHMFGLGLPQFFSLAIACGCD